MRYLLWTISGNSEPDIQRQIYGEPVCVETIRGETINMSEVVIYSLVTAVFVGVSAGYLGSLMVLEKMALVGDALSHVALPGLAIGILFQF